MLSGGDIGNNSYIQRLQFTTRDSTVCDFGDDSGPFTNTLSHPGYRLSHLSGHDCYYHGKWIIVVNALTFCWKRDYQGMIISNMNPPRSEILQCILHGVSE